MRQLTCTGGPSLEWRDVDEPRLQGGGEALVRPLAVARCEIDPFLIAGASTEQPPFALGHEAVAEIVELGDAVSGLTVGQRVVVSFQLSCGSCGSCGAGHSANCDKYPVLSDYGMQPLSGVEYGGMLSDLLHVPHAEAMLCPVPDGIASADLASVSDNVLDGYRTVARHLKATPGADVLFACHGTPSLALYGVQAAQVLGAGKISFASDTRDVLDLAEKLGALPIETDFTKRAAKFPIVVDCGVDGARLPYALASTQPEGVCQSVSFYGAPTTPVPLGKLYTLGIQFFVGRAHAVSLLPEVMNHIAEGRIQPGKVTTRTVGWEDAAEAFLEPSIKLVVERR